MDTIRGREILRLSCVLGLWLLASVAYAAEPPERGTRHLVRLEVKTLGAAVSVQLNGLPVLSATEGDRRSFEAVVNACVHRGANTVTLRWKPRPSADASLDRPSLILKESVVNAATSRTVREQILAGVDGSASAVTAPAAADGTVEWSRPFTIGDYPVAELPWTQSTGKPLSSADQQAIRQFAMDLLRAYNDRDADRLCACYRPKLIRLALTTGLGVDKLEQPQRRLMDSFFADPLFSLVLVKAEDLQITPMNGLNLVQVTRPHSKPLVDIRLRKATFKSELYLCRVGSRWEIAE